MVLNGDSSYRNGITINKTYDYVYYASLILIKIIKMNCN